MKTKVDFSLSHRYGVVERIIFRLVLNGYGKITDISEALPIFSDSVIANGICHLINQQILSVNHVSVLNLSEPIKALMIICHEKDFEIEVPKNLEKEIKQNGIVISGNSPEIILNKELILKELLPDFRLDFLVNSLDFHVYTKEGNTDE